MKRNQLDTENNYINDYCSLVDALILEYAEEFYEEVKNYEQKTTK